LAHADDINKLYFTKFWWNAVDRGQSFLLSAGLIKEIVVALTGFLKGVVCWFIA
jgi:hypothetical protein